VIEVTNVTKDFGGIRAVDDISFKLEKGEALGLLGPNAAGKTTLMRIMTGYIQPTSGRVSIDGTDIASDPSSVKRRIGYLPEHPPLYPDMTVRGYLQFCAEIKGVPGRKRRERVNEAIEKTSLGDVAGRLIENISKGYRQRVGLAQALVHNPEVLILDEPTVGLDPHQIIEIRNLIRELAAEHTVLLSSHILPEVAATCDRVIILNEGAVVAIDTQEQLKLRVSGGERLAVELAGAAAAEAAEAYSGLPGVAAVKPVNTGDPGAVRLVIECSKNSDPRADIFKKTVERGWTMLELSRDSLSLEDVFLKLTREESGAND